MKTFFDIADEYGGVKRLADITGKTSGAISHIKAGRLRVSREVHEALLDELGDDYDIAGTIRESQSRFETFHAVDGDAA